MMCETNGIKPLVERSERGTHVCIFFKKPISASQARNFGFLLLDKGSASINLKSFHYYDRIILPRMWQAATPKRGDNLKKIIHMLLGPSRHSYNAKERAMEQGIGHYIYPRYTRVMDRGMGKRWLLCGRDFGNSCPMKINLIESTLAGLIIIRGGESIRGEIGEQPEES